MFGQSARLGAMLLNVAITMPFAAASLLAVNTASLGGTVVDPSGAPVPGATVTAEDMETGLQQKFVTGPDGSYLFPELAVGNYSLRVEKSGFKTYVQQGIILSVGEAATQPVTMQVGVVTQNITVSSNAEPVETREAAVGQVVTEKQILDLPLNGRTAQSLVFLSVGTADVSIQNCGFGCNGGVYPGEQYASSSGGGPNGVYYQLDGISHNDSYQNMNLPFPNPDAVQEFNVQMYNMSAQYGHGVSSVVNVITKSGTDQFHGDLFEFVRNGDLNARNFFAPVQDTLKRNQFGGSFGGPIKKGKLFFFGTYQGTRVRQAPEGAIAFVPTAAERNGDFSALCPQGFTAGICSSPNGEQIVNPVTGAPYLNNQVPTSQFEKLSTNILQYIPLPNGPNGQLTYQSAPTNNNDDQFLVRIDYNRGKNQISGRYFFSNYDQPAQVNKTNLIASDPYGNAVRVQTVSANWTYNASPTLLFTTTFGSVRQYGGSLSSAPFSMPSLGAKIAATNPPELSINVSGYFNIETGHYGAFNRANPFMFTEDITKVKRKHELHFGGEVIRTTSPIANEFQQNGQYIFQSRLSGDNITDFLLGRAQSVVQAGGIYGSTLGTNGHLFIQDNWKVTPRLTVNAGLRWDPYVPLHDTKGRLACRNPGSTQISTRYPTAPPGLLFAGDPGCPPGTFYSNLSNLAPRLGFAYRLTADGKTSLRGGAGIYYQSPETVLYQDIEGIAPFAPIVSLTAVDFTDPFGSAGIANPFPAAFGPNVPSQADAAFPRPVTIFAVVAPNFKIARIGTYNLTLERQFGSSWVLSARYVGNQGRHLFGESSQKSIRESNPAVYGPGATEANTQQRRIDPIFGSIGYVESGYESNYNSLQLNLERRFSRGFSLLTNYVWSHQLDNFNSWQNYEQTDPFNRQLDHGPSNEDLSAIWKVSGLWQIPAGQLGEKSVVGKFVKGWELTTSTIWQGGFPLTLHSGLDNSFSGVFADHANITTSNIRSLEIGSGRSRGQMVSEFFNTSVVTPNPVGTFGNLGKGVLRGPKFFNSDIGLIKRTTINERMSAEFRGEFFNAFNHTTFPVTAVDTTFTDPSFGQLLSANNPRIIQFALKLVF